MTRILVVDDEGSACDALEEILRGEGYDVRTARSGEQALALAPVFEPHLLLTDLRMPGMSGLELIAQVRALGTSAKALVMSAAVERPLDCDAPFVSKPIDVDRLLETIARAVPKAA